MSLRRRNAVGRVSPLLLLALSAVTATAMTAPAAATTEIAAFAQNDLPRDFPPEWNEAVADYIAATPGMTVAAAERAVVQRQSRITLLERLAETNEEQFGGARFDPLTGVVHVNVTGPEAAAAAIREGSSLGLGVAIHRVQHSYTELAAIAAHYAAGTDVLVGVAAKGYASVDVENNRVELAVLPPDYDRLTARSADLPDAVTITRRSLEQHTDEVCSSRFACGVPLRSGVVLSTHEPRCSLGYVASASDGSRWALTAGHCSSIDVQWRHGEQPIGPVRQTRNIGNVDVARIRIDNTYWRSGSVGGWMYNARDPDSPTTVDYAVTARGTILRGEVVCLSAWHATIGNSCGTITDTSNDRGMVQIDDYDACPGDSGGAWVWRTSSGDYWAYGVHQGGANATCHEHGPGWSQFTAVPDMNTFHDDANYPTIIRIITR